MTDAQIKHMVDRFLMWKLPAAFNPDGGISFERIAGASGPHPFVSEPVGTNLFSADQAAEMVRHMLEGLPSASPAPSTEGLREALAGWDVEDIQCLRRMVPDLDAVMTHNPIAQVYFRAGLLACRETMARFVEQGGNLAVAASIRANWWPSLGDDPGAPRQLAYDEVAAEQPSGRIEHADISPSIEALGFAWCFLNSRAEARTALAGVTAPSEVDAK